MLVPSASTTISPSFYCVTIPTISMLASTATLPRSNRKKVELPDDKVEEFEILLEYMLRGTTPGSIEFTEVGTLETPVE
jgi:hypothetical protein